MIASQNQLKTLIIGDNIAIGALPASGVQVTPSNLPVGAVCLTDPSGLRVVASGLAAKTGKYVLVQSQGPSLPLIKSDVIDFSTAEINYKAHVPPKEQVSYIGNIGSGSLQLPAALATTGLTKSFFGSVDVIDFNVSGNRIIKKEFNYFATDADTSTSIATGLVKNMIDNVAKMSEPFYKAERVAVGTVGVLSGSSTVTKVTKGSNVVEVYTVTADANSSFTASTATVTAGNVINFPSTNGTVFTFPVTALGTTAGHITVYIGTTAYVLADTTTADANGAALAALINGGTQATASYDTATDTITLTYRDYAMFGMPLVLTTDDNAVAATQVTVTTTVGDAVPVKYVVKETTSSAATFLLDIAWQGETQYFFDGTTAALNSGVATLTGAPASLWGIKVTGKPKQYIPQVMRGFEKVRFTISLGDNFNGITCPVTNSIAAAEGAGTSYQIQELERFSQMNQGNRYTSYNPPTVYISNAVAYGLNFNTFSLSFRSEAKHGIVNNSQFPQEILVAGVEGTNTQFSDATNGLWELLETLSGTTFTAWS
jgi:hypothetical protein